MTELIKYGDEGYARQQAEIPICHRNYWVYLPDGTRIDSKTNDFEKACQITAIHASGLNDTNRGVKAFPSQHNFNWTGDDWVTAPFTR